MAIFSSKRQFYLHVGIHKTASTYLQREVFPKLKGVRHVKHSKERQKFLHLFFRSPAIWRGMAREVYEASFGDEAGRGGNTSLLYSNENISTPHCFLSQNYRLRGLRKDPAMLAQHLQGFNCLLGEQGFGSLRVMIFIRRQDQWVGSWYSQQSDRIKGASQADFEQKVMSLLSPDKQLYTDGAWLSYNYLFDVLVSAVGRRNLFFCPYELLQQDPEHVWRLLKRFFGGTVTGFPAQTTADRRRVGRTGDDRWQIRGDECSDQRGEIVLTPELKERILDMFHSENRELSSKLPVDLSRFGYF